MTSRYGRSERPSGALIGHGGAPESLHHVGWAERLRRRDDLAGEGAGCLRVKQDLFKEGRAEETADAALVAAALAKPGEVLTRSKGAKALAAFQAAAPAKPTDGPTAAQRRRVEKLEAELDALEGAFARRQDELGEQIARLEVE